MSKQLSQDIATKPKQQLRNILLLAIGLGVTPTLYSILGSGGSLHIESFILLIITSITTTTIAVKYSKQNETTTATALLQRKIYIKQISAKYNNEVNKLVDSYNVEMDSSWLGSLSKNNLQEKYSFKYKQIRNAFQLEKQGFISLWGKNNPTYKLFSKFWLFLLTILFCSSVLACTVNIPSLYSNAQSSYLTERVSYWNAENIPIPHLEDASQYVSNPDSVLSETTVKSMNAILQNLDNELDIESVFIIVNHIENDNPFRMAQDVGNKYGVGRNDRGLIVVCGYLDHSINISPGKSLEADLTDAECYQLEQRYVVPAMKAEMPDSAMLYLAEGIFSFMKNKEMPKMSNLSSNKVENDNDELAVHFGLYTFYLISLIILFIRINSKYQWFELVGATSLIDNPFLDIHSNNTFHGIEGFGSGGIGGGSFGGGSFGGGGATSRW